MTHELVQTMLQELQDTANFQKTDTTRQWVIKKRLRHHVRAERYHEGRGAAYSSNVDEPGTANNRWSYNQALTIRIETTTPDFRAQLTLRPRYM